MKKEYNFLQLLIAWFVGFATAIGLVLMITDDISNKKFDEGYKKAQNDLIEKRTEWNMIVNYGKMTAQDTIVVIDTIPLHTYYIIKFTKK